jgi:hypothetical protein
MKQTWMETRGIVYVKAVSLNRPFLVHLTELTAGFESTLQVRRAGLPFSTRSGFSGPTFTRG